MAEWIEEIKRAIRAKSSDADDEVKDLINACKSDMKLVGINITDETDPLYRQAVKLYCKAYYGYDDNVERFRLAYESLRDSMSLSGDYRHDS